MERNYEKIEVSSAFWKPDKEGEQIEGEVISKSEDDFGLKVVLKVGDDEMTMPSHKLLQNRLSKAKIGDFVKVQFTGEELPKIKGQNPLKLYDVWIDKA